MIMNKKLYEEVFKTVVDAFEFEQIFMDNTTIDRRITD
nr:MAG TPA: RNA polymerase II transcription factor [Caudoviricetes sp.]